MVTRLHPYWPNDQSALGGPAEQAEEMVRPWLSKAEAIVKEKPGLVVGAAIALGVVLGYLVKRR